MDLLINDYVGVQATHPISKTPKWRTDVVKFDSGKEQRGKVRETPTRAWGIAWDILNTTQRAKLLEIYNRAKGKYGTFQFRDPNEEDGNFSVTAVAYMVTAASSSGRIFTILGSYADVFTDGVHFEIIGNSVNDGDWVVDGDSTSDDTNTTVIVTVAPTTITPITDYTIISSDNGTLKFIISGDYTTMFLDGVIFTVASGVNAGDWVVDGDSTVDGINTAVIVTIAPATTLAAYAVTTADAPTLTFTITDDYTAIFLNAITFTVVGGVNAGVWTVDGNSTFGGGLTSVVVTVAPTTTAVADTATTEVIAVSMLLPVALIQDYQLTHTSYNGTDEEYTEIKNEIQHFDIIAVSVANDTFTIFGGHIGKFETDIKFIVTNSTGNDENWVVESSIRAGENTIITVVGNITNTTADGILILVNIESNAVEQTPGVDYEIDERTGIVQFLADKAPLSLYVVVIIFKYAFLVRFNSDAQAMSEFSDGSYEYMDIELMEVKP